MLKTPAIFKTRTSLQRPSKHAWLIAALALTLAGCGSTPQLPSVDTTAIEQSAELDDVRQLLEQARNSTSPQRERYYLLAAQQLHEQEENDWARNLLHAIDPALLSPDNFIHYTLLFSAIAMDNSAYFLAQRILTNTRLEQQWQSLPLDTQLTLGERRATLFALLGESTDSVKERIRLSDLQPDASEYEHNQDAIWQTLMTVPQVQLHYLSQKEEDPLLRGWYSLAALSKNNQTDLEKQQQKVDLWRSNWPQHPANQRLPNDLQLLQQLIREKPLRIALLLPQQGNLATAGKAIREGFFAAYYQALREKSQIPEIQVYDSSQGDINTLYQKAVNEGAQLVVGPLDKDKVAVLNRNLVLPVPTLALNYIEPAPALPATPTPASTPAPLAETTAPIPATDSAEYTEGLFQFGLAAEDEARQAARRAWLEGHRHALILAPETSWGKRTSLAFHDEWRALGGDIADIASFSGSGDYSKVIKNALLVQQSQDRARQLRQLFGKSIEFEPRRRQDVDMIFLVATATQARQIKPTLAFHYAGKLPVYATRQIYTGVEDRKSDRDLNGIKFSTLPWVFDQHSPEKQAIDSYAKASPAYNHLYALGVDAYRLYPRLKQLHQVPEARLYGTTGALRLTANRKVEREQMWAQIRGGRARPLPVVVSGVFTE